MRLYADPDETCVLSGSVLFWTRTGVRTASHYVCLACCPSWLFGFRYDCACCLVCRHDKNFGYLHVLRSGGCKVNHFCDIVTSSSKMHRLVNMDMDACFNKYVTDDSKTQMKALLQIYNRDKSYENFMRVLSNCPMGIELFMRCTTNYLQLKTIYHQRKHHKLTEDWVEAFCKDFIENLPYAEEFITNTKKQ